MSRSLILPAVLLCATACKLDQAQPRMGNYAVEYTDVLRVYIDDALVAEITDGEDADIEVDGQTLAITTLCSDEGVVCPSESFWSEVAVDQPWGDQNTLLNFVNLSADRGTPGQRIGGLLEEDGTFAMLSGVALAGNDACAVLGVGTVTGAFRTDNSGIDSGIVAYEWAGACQIGEVTIGSSLRLETDYIATRTGPFDLSSITPEPAVDADGDPLAGDTGVDTADTSEPV